jgi:hypothetical protein
MMPVFGNPAGFWALLGLPAILAIHFLQQRARLVRTSTWFLIERLAPDSARGRTWDRLRSSRTLWFQLLAVLIASWILVEPRWVRAESAQTVVLVLDASASMEAFRAPAVAAAEREMNAADGLAARTTWVVMTTHPRQPPLYRGGERAAASAALARWQPEMGRHDPAPALRLARGLAGASGRTLLITDTRATVPAGQRAAGVGRPIDNVGFAGATIGRDEQGVTLWRALVKNHAATPQQRTWHFEMGMTRSASQELQLPAGALVEISASLPVGVDQAVVVLSPDDFAPDDRLPLVRPAPKPLSIAVESTDPTAEFFRKLAPAVDGVTVVSGGVEATLRLAQLSTDALALERHGGIFWPLPDRRAQVPLLTEPVTPERDPLVNELNWQGWFGTGPHGFVPAPGDRVILWQGRWPLVFVREPRAAAKPGETPVPVGTRQLALAFDWATSNADRLPATVLLARRFLETERDLQRGPYAANFDAASPVPLPGVTFAPGETLALEFQPPGGAAPTTPETRVIPFAETADVRAPGRSGFFTLRRGEEVLVRGAAQFADARLGDFRAADTFFADVESERAAAIERNTMADPFANAWLALLALLVLASWWMRQSAPSQPGTPGASAIKSTEENQPVEAALR